MDKAMDTLPAVALVVLLPFVGLHLSRPLWALLLSALGVIGLGAAVLAFAVYHPERVLALITRTLAIVLPQRLRPRIEPAVAQFIDTLVALIHRPRLLLTAAAYTLVAVCLDALFCLLAFRSVGVAIAPGTVLYGYTFYNLAFILPTPPGQVGSNELVGLLIFSGVFGLRRSGVGAMFLFSHPWTAILMTVSGLACLSTMGLTLGRTLHLARQQQSP
jgi:uncharacterized membrane protein YbhN (UPF0104 family)